MNKMILPKIPRGNLSRVYVLSKKAAEEFFIESAAIVRENWPLPELYRLPSEAATITLESYPTLWLPHTYRSGERLIGTGSFIASIGYTQENPRHRQSHGLGQNILDFLCEVEDKEIASDSRHPYYLPACSSLVPSSHIFIYNMGSSFGLSLPPEAFKYSGVEKKVEEALNEKLRPALKIIRDKIGTAAEKRSAVLTRGWLSGQFVL